MLEKRAKKELAHGCKTASVCYTLAACIEDVPVMAEILTSKKTLEALKAYYKGLTEDQQEALVAGCGTSRGQFVNLCYATRRIKPEMAVAIDRETNGLFRMTDLCPEPGIDWTYIMSTAGRDKKS